LPKLTLKEYHSTMDILSDRQIEYLYLQGVEDCVFLLRELGVIDHKNPIHFLCSEPMQRCRL